MKTLKTSKTEDFLKCLRRTGSKLVYFLTLYNSTLFFWVSITDFLIIDEINVKQHIKQFIVYNSGW